MSKDYLNAAISGMNNTNENCLLPEQLTLHEVVSTIQRVGYIIRKINYKRHTDCVNEIRSLLTAILLECEFFQPNQELYEPMKIITPCLWYWAISNNNITIELPDFHTIYCYEGLLLKSFLENCNPFVIPECKAFNALLKTLEKYYKTVKPNFLADETQLHYKITKSVMQWRTETNQITEEQKQEDKTYTENWFVENNTLLVEVPELPPNWVQKDPVKRPVLFDDVLKKYKNGAIVTQLPVSDGPGKNLGTNATNITNVALRSPSAPSSSTYYYKVLPEPVRRGPSINYSESPSVQSVSDHEDSILSQSIKSVSVYETSQGMSDENLYEFSATLRWRDTINNRLTNVIIARNKNTGKLEISEQIFDNMFPYLAEIIVQHNGVLIKK